MKATDHGNLMIKGKSTNQQEDYVPLRNAFGNVDYLMVAYAKHPVVIRSGKQGRMHRGCECMHAQKNQNNNGGIHGSDCSYENINI